MDERANCEKSETSRIKCKTVSLWTWSKKGFLKDIGNIFAIYGSIKAMEWSCKFRENSFCKKCKDNVSKYNF